MEIQYNKLIRDKIPEIISASGKESTIRTLDSDEYIGALQAKLQEELNEYLQSNEIEELADILEVINAILDHNNIDFQALEQIRSDKREKRGGFEKKLFLIKVCE